MEILARDEIGSAKSSGMDERKGRRDRVKREERSVARAESVETDYQAPG